MLQVVPYENLHELDNLNFVRDKKSEIIVICPNSHLADIYQDIFSVSGNKVRVCTISRFLSENLSKEFGEDFFDQYVSKADLFLKLAIIWKNKFPEQAYEVYNQAFNLLTELRSFTIHDRLISEALIDINPQIKLAIEYFNFTINQLGLIDEHQAYFKLSEMYRSENLQHINENNISMVFWGFHHMTALQIDFLKAASIKHDIYVPFPAQVYSSSLSSDWIRWITPSLNIENKSCLNKVKLISFPSGKLCETLKTYLNNNSDLSTDFYLATKNPTLDQFCEIPIKQMMFKTVSNVFADDVDCVHQEMLNLMEIRKGVLIWHDVLDYLSLIVEQEGILPDHKKNFRRLKSLLLFKSSYEKWINLSESNKKVMLFDLKIVYKYITLCLPRTYSLPLLEESTFYGFGLESIVGFDLAKRNIICATADYTDLKKSDSLYDEKIFEFFSAIGPVKRSQLDFEINRFYLREILKQDQNILFLEAGLLEKSIGWKEILSDFVLDGIGGDTSVAKIPTATDTPIMHLNDYVASKKTKKLNISPSNLQKWLDCPRKYHFLVEQKIDNHPVLLKEISPADLGALEHKLIEIIIKGEKELTPEEIGGISRTELEKYISERKLTINIINMESYTKEVASYVSNGVRLLNEFKRRFCVSKYLFEHSISQENEEVSFKGRVDLLAITPNGHFVIDFKRSAGGVATLSDVKKFEQIQLPFYLSHLGQDRFMLFAGYICLSDIAESNFLCFDQDCLNILVELELVSSKNSVNHIADFTSWINQYNQIEKDQIEKISNEKFYLPIPRKVEVCRYCIIKNICTRG